MATPTWIDYYNNLMAGAQSATAARSVSPANQIKWRYALSDKEQFTPGGKSVGDRLWNDNLSVGKRILDILSRGTYASAAFKKYQLEHAEGDDPLSALKDLADIPGAFAAGFKGLKGQEKTTYGDIRREAGLSTGTGVTNFIADLGLDIGLDPTTYVGLGPIAALARGAKKTGKITDAAVKPAVKIAADELATTGKAVVPAKTADEFIRNVTRNSENPGAAFDTVTSTAREISREAPGGPMPRGASNITDARLFVGGPEGIAERFMLPGPSADVLTNRAMLADWTNKAKGIPQFEYGRAVDEIPESGFWNEIVEKVPNEPGGVPQLRPKEIETGPTGWEDLPEVTNPNPIRNAILRTPDEPVFSHYELKQAKDGSTYFVPSKDARETTVGELRRIIATSDRPEIVKMARTMLQNHMNTVETYAKSKPAGYRSAEEFMKEMYGNAWKAAKGKAVPKIEDLPEGPFTAAAKAQPTFKEVKRLERMSDLDKWIFLNSHGLSRSDITYLSQASNQASFKTRLAKVQGRVRAEPTRDLSDLVDAIKTGRIQSMEEPGLPELMKELGVTTLNQLVKKIESQQGRLSKAEQKMLRTGKDQPVTKATIEKPNITQELGPTGEIYSGYKTEQAVQRAKKIVAERVKPADKIVQEAKAGDKSALATNKATLNTSQQAIFDGALRWAVQHEVVDPRNKDIWAWITRSGVLRNSPTPNAGKGRVKDVWNKYSQYTFFKEMMNNAPGIDAKIKEILNEAGVKGTDRLYARGKAMYDLMMPVMKGMDDTLRQGGVFPVAGVRSQDTLFSLHDALSVMPEDWVIKHIFTLDKKGNSIIAPTQFMDAFDYLVTATKAGEEVSTEFLGDMLATITKTRNGKTVPNGLAYRVGRIKGDEAKRQYLDAIAEPMANGLPDLSQAVERNVAQRKLYHENQVEKGKNSALEVLADQILDPLTSPGDMAKLAADPDIIVKPITRLHGIDPDDAWMVKQEVTAAGNGMGVLTPELAAVGKGAKAQAGAKTKSAKSKVGAKLAAEAEQQSTKAAEELGIPLSDLGTRFEMSNTYRMMQAFAPHLGNSAVRPLFLDRKSVAQNLARGYQSLLGQINRTHTRDALNAAWKELQGGTRSTDEAIGAAQDDLSKAINVLFSKDPDYNVFSRNNITPADVNTHFKHYQIHDKYRFSDDMNNDWREWDTDNPLDLLGKVQAATMAAMSKRLLGDDLVHRFASPTAKEGYVKLSSKGSVLAHYLDLEQYYPRDIAQQFRILDNFIKQSMKPTEFNKALSIMDNALHSYKAGMTIYRPGHHIRNMVGDVWLSHMAGVNSPVAYTKAAKVMAQNHGRYQDFDAIQAYMARQPQAKIVDDGSPVAHIRVKGKRTPLSGGEIYRAAFDRGILNDYRTLEDIQMGSESLSAKIANSKFNPIGGRLHRGAASFSEARDHYVRLAHFIDYLGKGNFSSLEDAITKAAHEVRKWHPDGSDLTHFESKVMRRSVLFYSWLRKALPLVVESMVMKPGKVMVFPKAMYEMAENNGIDLNSLSDPFPTDQMFPDWISDSITGPVGETDEGHYLGVNPGVPFVDIINDFAGPQAKRNILGSINPLAKWPIEMTAKPEGAVAEDLRTGIPSYDLSDYVDRQVPGFGYLANFTGRSPSQLFMEPKGGEDKVADPSGMSFLNWLSGMGVMDMSKPSYQRQAEKDFIARLRREAG